ncbi:hypothetical protein N8781_01190 [Porticoccaceae bacterium]|nr:hypothetical protein [Porticoccaceae bacterium]
MRMLSVMACLVMFSGCSVQSSQLSAVMGFFETQDADLSLNGWSVKYANYEAMVYPVSLPDGTLFSNKAGDQVFFDGWSVRRVSGLGLRGQEYQNSDVADERTFMRGNRTLAVHKCDQWKKKQQSGKKQFSQSCKDVKIYSNIILVEEDGSIGVIRQVVDDRYNALTLTKLN